MSDVRQTRIRKPSLAWRGLLALAAISAGVAAAPEPPQKTREAPAGHEREYVRWLEERSMLAQARAAAAPVSGSGVQWRHPYAEPRPEDVVRSASVWLLDYPGSVIPAPGKSVIATWGEPRRWELLREIGIELLHTGPVKRAGGICGREYTPTIDGWFDRISLEIDPDLGTEEEYRRLVEVAAAHGAWVAGDLVPLHTGFGADFRLALLNHADYPGMYTMAEVRKEDWHLLPRVDEPWGAAHVPKEAAAELAEKGYIPGLINSNDAAPEAKRWSGWSASGEVVGTDGKTRRWVYLHYFKPAQPTLNWLDPTAAAPRAVLGDLAKSVHTLGAKVMRLDAIPFLGIEPQPGQVMSLHYKHPLSVARTNEMAFLARKLGGYTFHELNVALDELKPFVENGPDLSYDFFTRAQCVHSLLTGDAALLRQAFGFLLEKGVPPNILFHDLQNHDEITYQLVELDYRGDDTLTLGGEKILGRRLKERVLREMRAKAAGEAAPYNKLYRPEKDGLATTFAGLVAAALGVRDPYRATPEQVGQIGQGHYLLAFANAMQPGVFGLSSWDLVGALPVPEESVRRWIGSGDYRWVNRGGVDLTGANPGAGESPFGVPRAKALYGPLPEQLKDPGSFASRLKRLLAARKRYRIPEGELLAVPEVKQSAVCVLVMRLPRHPVAVTALNFSREEVAEEIDLGAASGAGAAALAGRCVTDVLTGEPVGKVSGRGRVMLRLGPWAGATLVVE